LRILLVEDDPMNVELFESALESDGQFTAPGNGQQHGGKERGMRIEDRGLRI